jgi:two-component system CheB/CheR fusion protein
VEISISVARDRTGQLQYAAGMIRDISKRKRIEEKLAKSNARLEVDLRERTQKLTERAALLDLSFDAIVVRDRNDRIIYLNRGAVEMYGWSCSAARGKVIHQLFRTRFPEPLEQIQQKLRQEGRWSGELVHRRRDGSILIVATRWALQLDPRGDIAAVLETNTDITERKEAEKALLRREQELATFFEESPLALFWISPAGVILRANRAASNLLGHGAEELRSSQVSAFSAEAGGAERLLKRLSGRETITNQRLRLRNKEGSIRHVLVDANGLWEAGALLYSRWFVRDVTRSMELEQEILAVGEREQRRLGQDLHDDLCQQLTGIELLSQTLAGKLGKQAIAGAAQAKEIAAMVRHVMVRTRELAHGLSPLPLGEEGLMLALKELAARTQKLFGKSCRFYCPRPALVTDQNVGMHLYRIAQEAIGNALKHSKARQLEIRLIAEPTSLSLEVRDDGVGLPKRLPVSESVGMGLRTMQYRAQVINGRLRLQKNPAGGTTVACDLLHLSQPPSSP